MKAGKPGLTVCLWKGEELYAVGETDAKGAAVFMIETKTPGTIRVAVTGPSVNAVTATIKVKS